MKKRILTLVTLVLIMTLTLVGCGGTSDENTVNDDLGKRLEAASAEEIALYLQENLEFEDIMSSLDSDIALSLYNLTAEQTSECFMVGSTGATAEEIAVFTVNENAGDAVADACMARVEAQKLSFENYLPKELEKLETPVIINEGNKVIMVICNEHEYAEKLIDSFGK